MHLKKTYSFPKLLITQRFIWTAHLDSCSCPFTHSFTLEVLVSGQNVAYTCKFSSGFAYISASVTVCLYTTRVAAWPWVKSTIGSPTIPSPCVFGPSAHFLFHSLEAGWHFVSPCLSFSTSFSLQTAPNCQHNPFCTILAGNHCPVKLKMCSQHASRHILAHISKHRDHSCKRRNICMIIPSHTAFLIWAFQ